MSADGNIVRAALFELAAMDDVQTRARRDGLAALARLEAAEAQRDALAEALRFIATSHANVGALARAALAETGLG